VRLWGGLKGAADGASSGWQEKLGAAQGRLQREAYLSVAACLEAASRGVGAIR